MDYTRILILPALVVLLGSVSTAHQPPNPSEAQRQALVGNWEWTLAVGPMRKKVSMEVLPKDDKLVAIVKLDDGTKLESKDLQVKDDRVRFSVRHEQNGHSISMAHDGILKEGKITGTAKMTGGPVDMSSKWDALKVRKK